MFLIRLYTYGNFRVSVRRVNTPSAILYHYDSTTFADLLSCYQTKLFWKLPPFATADYYNEEDFDIILYGADDAATDWGKCQRRFQLHRLSNVSVYGRIFVDAFENHVQSVDEQEDIPECFRADPTISAKQKAAVFGIKKIESPVSLPITLSTTLCKLLKRVIQ